MHFLGYAYFTGDGVTKNYDIAFKLFLTLQKGDVSSLTNIWAYVMRRDSA